VLELLDAVDELGEAALEGKFVSIVGQCDLSGDPEGKRFDLYRLQVVCCVADATSLGVEVARASPACNWSLGAGCGCRAFCASTARGTRSCR